MSDPLRLLSDFIEHGGFGRLHDEFRGSDTEGDSNGVTRYVPEEDALHIVERDDHGNWPDYKRSFRDFLAEHLSSIERQTLEEINVSAQSLPTQREVRNRYMRLKEQLDRLAISATRLPEAPFDYRDEVVRSVRLVTESVIERMKGGKRPTRSVGRPPSDPEADAAVRKRVQEMMLRDEYLYEDGAREGEYNITKMREQLDREEIGIHVEAKWLSVLIGKVIRQES